MPKSFSAQIEAFNAKALNRALVVLQQASLQLVNNSTAKKKDGGRIPIDQGFLRGSASAALNAELVPSPKPKKGDKPKFNLGPVVKAVVTMRPGDVLSYGFTVAYAARIEFGFSGADSLGRVYEQPGAGFLSYEVNRWQQLVDDAVAKL